MAGGSQGQKPREYGHNRNDAGTGQGGASAGQGRERASDSELGEMGRRLPEHREESREEMECRYRQVEGAIARYPTSAVFVAFGVGFGFGVAIVTAMARREEWWGDRYLPDSLRNRIPDQARDFHWSDAYERLYQSVQNLPSAVSRAVAAR